MTDTTQAFATMEKPQDTLYIIIEDAVQRMAPETKLTAEYHVDDIAGAFKLVLRNNPQYFWCDSCSYSPDRLTVSFHYTFSAEKTEFFKGQIESVVDLDFRIDHVASLPQPSRVLYIFKWLAEYTNYNPHSAFNQTITSVFVKRNSVCAGYAKAVQYLCGRVGINSRLVYGKLTGAPAHGRHCWNLVEIDGAWYHLDVCLGDIDTAAKIFPERTKPFVVDPLYDNICVSTSRMLMSRWIEDIESLPLCTKDLDVTDVDEIRLQPSLRAGDRGCQIAPSGMTGSVYLSRNDKHRVIKEAKSPQFRAAIEKEHRCYRALAGCEHILGYYGGDADSIVVEQATSLADLMQSSYYRPNTEIVAAMACDMAKAIKQCFDKGLAYRDIHIGNIYLSDDGRWLLGDFGHCEPVTPDSIYPARVGNRNFVTEEVVEKGLFNRYSAAKALIKILDFLYGYYNLKIPGIGAALEITDSEDPLTEIIRILSAIRDQIETDYRSTRTDAGRPGKWCAPRERARAEMTRHCIIPPGKLAGPDRRFPYRDIEPYASSADTMPSPMQSKQTEIDRQKVCYIPGESAEKSTPDGQDASACVYAPAEVSRDDSMMVQVYLYRDVYADEVRAKAVLVDSSAKLRQYKPLEVAISAGAEVRIHLKVRGAEIEGSDTKSFKWTGTFKGCEFSVYVPADYSRSAIVGEVDVFVDNMPAGEMIFKTNVVVSSQPDIMANVATRAFEKIFVSYSSLDHATVRPMVEGLRISRKKYFFAPHSLNGGDRFRDEIYKWIEDSDVFVLCWSKNAAESKEVTREKNHALEVISRPGSHLKIYPIKISPEAPLPADMIDTYNFAQLNP